MIKAVILVHKMKVLKTHVKQQLTDFAIELQQAKRGMALGTQTLTPINYHEEKQKFFKNPNYSPQFQYKKYSVPDAKERIKNLKKQLNQINLPKDLHEYCLDVIVDVKNTIDAVEHVGKENFEKYAKKVFPYEAKRLKEALSDAKNIHPKPPKDSPLFDSKKISEDFQEVLKNRYNIQDAKVEIDHFNDHTVRVGNKKIVIGSKIKRYKQSIDRLIVHEIESHILQRANTSRSPILLLTKLSDRTLYGEGMAVYNEVKTKTITDKVFSLYKNRVKAVTLLDKSFAEMVDILSEELNPKVAFLVAYRVKRGMADTSRPGGFPKDAYYLLGYETVKKYLKNNKSYEFLYNVRVPKLGDLVKKYDIIPLEKPQYFPKF